MITALGQLTPRLHLEGIPLHAILLGEADPLPWREALMEAGCEAELRQLRPGRGVSQDWAEGEPLVYLKRGGAPIFLRVGLDTAVDDMVQLALDITGP